MVNIISDYIPPFSPLPNIAPFTYKDGETYLSTLENIRSYVNNTLVEFINSNINDLGNQFVVAVNALITEFNTNLNDQNTDVDTKISTLTDFVNSTVDTINTTLANQTTANTEAITNTTTYVNTQISNLTDFVNDQVNSIINSSVIVNDSVIKGVISDLDSQTRQYFDETFFAPEVNDVPISGLIIDPASDTRIALDANFANKATQTLVETGRLSETDLNTTIDSRANDIVSAINWDSEVETLITNDSDTRTALDTRYAPNKPQIKYKAFRPYVYGVGPGVNSVIDGKCYFDGVQIHYELSIEMASTGSGFVTGAAAFATPSEMEAKVTDYEDLICGLGVAHSAATGNLYAIIGMKNGNATIRFFYQNGTQYAGTTATLPFAWGVLDAIKLKGSYIPKYKVMPRNFTAYGDSITRFEQAAGIEGGRNWTQYVPVEGLMFGGGYAADSATSAIVLAGAKPLNSDVGVCLVGVNDIAGSVPLATTLANVSSIRTKIASDKFLLCKLAPYNGNPIAANAMNVAYQTLADNNGWTTCDPYAAYRATDGTWIAGASDDGTHPTTAVQQAAAIVIRNAINAINPA